MHLIIYIIIYFVLFRLLIYLFIYLINYSLTHSTQHTPFWQANRFAASQQILCILWSPSVHYCIHKCALTLSILIQLKPVHNFKSRFLKIHVNIILLSTPCITKWSPSLSFPTKSLYTPFHPHIRYMSRPSLFSRFNHPHNIGWAVQIIKPLGSCLYIWYVTDSDTPAGRYMCS
jgi:hypothetical protein